MTPIPPALRRRGDKPFPDGTEILSADGTPRYVVQDGAYVAISTPVARSTAAAAIFAQAARGAPRRGIQ